MKLWWVFIRVRERRNARVRRYVALAETSEQAIFDVKTEEGLQSNDHPTIGGNPVLSITAEPYDDGTVITEGSYVAPLTGAEKLVPLR